jgi:hypothetical protein
MCLSRVSPCHYASPNSHVRVTRGDDGCQRATARTLLLLLAVLILVCASQTSSFAQSTPAVAIASATPAHTVLKDVLSRKEFQQYTAQPHGVEPPSAFARLLQQFGRECMRAMTKMAQPVKQLFKWLGRHLQRVMPKSPSDRQISLAGKIFHYTLLSLFGLAIVLLLGLGIYFWYFTRQRRHTLRNEMTDAGSPSPHALPALGAWDQMMQSVETLWQQGRQREALRTLHGACLTLLDRRGVLRYDESRANGEVLRELRRQGHHQAQQTLAPIMRAFDRSWYGFLPLSGEDFTAVKEQSRQFHAGMLERRNA